MCVKRLVSGTLALKFIHKFVIGIQFASHISHLHGPFEAFASSALKEIIYVVEYLMFNGYRYLQHFRKYVYETSIKLTQPTNFEYNIL